MNSADDLQDRLIRHQVQLLRFGNGLRNRLIGILNQGDAALASRIRDELDRLNGRPRLDVLQQVGSIDSVIDTITRDRRAKWNDFQSALFDEIAELSVNEAEFTVDTIKQALPVDLNLKKVSAEQTRAAVESRPFEGRNLRDWANALMAKDQERLSATLRQGIVDQKSIEDIVDSVRGTRGNRFTDGVLQIARRDADSVVRTVVNHVSNIARNEIFEANSEFIQGVKWIATLDGRTSGICRGRDGKIALIGSHGADLPDDFPRLTPANARPPAHFNCRSLTVPVFDTDAIAERLDERILATDSPSSQQRERDFRAEAKAIAGDRQWKRLSTSEQNELIKQRRRDWTAENVGRVPHKTTYDEWLRRQPEDFQDEVLGKEKAKVFRGGLKLDRFVDRTGRELTLKELMKDSSLEPVRPAMSLKQQKSSSVDFRKEIAAANASIPRNVADRLGRKGVKIRTAERFVDIRPDLADVKPRSWPEGTTWKNSNGGYDPETGQIVLGEFIEDYPTGKTVPGPVPGGTLRHEVGHAWDDLGFDSGTVRDRLEFKEAHATDIKRIGSTFNDDELDSIAYFLEASDDANRQETVAELFGILTGGGADPRTEQLLRKAFPESIQVLKRTIGETE